MWMMGHVGQVGRLTGGGWHVDIFLVSGEAALPVASDAAIIADDAAVVVVGFLERKVIFCQRMMV